MNSTASASRRAAPAEADRPFFLLAALHAALSVPLWTLGWLGHAAAAPPLADAPLHGHEMIAGYALAVIAGFLFTRIDRMRLALALALWLAGRLAPFADLPPLVQAAIGLAFPLLLFVLAGLPFLRAARSAHNAIFAPVLGAFLLAELLFRLSRNGLIGPGDGGTAAAIAGLDAVALLLLAMGGRLIPAATAGAIRAKSGLLLERVQPRLEWLGFFALVLAMVLDLFPSAARAAGAASLVAGGAVLYRLSRWRSRHVLDRRDLWALHLGYLWLGAGLALKGAAQLAGLPASGALHGIAVGALGTMTLAMMARTLLQRRRRPVEFPRWLAGCVLLVSLAALLRLAALWPDWHAAALAVAAAAWSLAFLGLALFALRVGTVVRPPPAV